MVLPFHGLWLSADSLLRRWLDVVGIFQVLLTGTIFVLVRADVPQLTKLLFRRLMAVAVTRTGEEHRSVGGEESEIPLSVCRETASSLDKLRRLRTILGLVVI